MQHESMKNNVNTVATRGEDNTSCRCSFCGKTLAAFKNDTMMPSAEACYKRGNVPVPNVGWFCSQKCALDYETKFDIRFARTLEGKIDYYV